MRDMFTTAIEIVGAVLIVAGIGLIWAPAAVIVAGVALIGLSERVSR